MDSAVHSAELRSRLHICGTQTRLKVLIIMTLALDLKSAASNGVPVRFRLRAPGFCGSSSLVKLADSSVKIEYFRERSIAAASRAFPYLSLSSLSLLFFWQAFASDNLARSLHARLLPRSTATLNAQSAHGRAGRHGLPMLAHLTNQASGRPLKSG